MTSRFGCALRGVYLRLVAGTPHSSARSAQASDVNLPMKQVVTAGLLLALCLVSVAQESDTTFKVDVKLVNVFVTGS